MGSWPGAVGGRSVMAADGIGPGPQRSGRFYRAEAARDRVSGGSGLGLAIVAALTGAMGGTVSAANDPTGGAVFRVELPAGALRPPSG